MMTASVHTIQYLFVRSDYILLGLFLAVMYY
jgi:hypothetical protein